VATKGMREIRGKAILRRVVVDGRRRCRRDVKPSRANIQVVGMDVSVGVPSTSNDATLVACNENGGGCKGSREQQRSTTLQPCRHFQIAVEMPDSEGSSALHDESVTCSLALFFRPECLLNALQAT
jgi:hypothetical protein